MISVSQTAAMTPPNIPSHVEAQLNQGPPAEISQNRSVLKETPVENLRPMRVIVIGAGYSGIYCGIRIPQKLRNVELCIYDKNAGVGGTWYENR